VSTLFERFTEQNAPVTVNRLGRLRVLDSREGIPKCLCRQAVAVGVSSFAISEAVCATVVEDFAVVTRSR
jgi:hypothetical protein